MGFGSKVRGTKVGDRAKIVLVPFFCANGIACHTGKQRRNPCSGPPDGLDELLEVHFEFPFILIGKLTLAFFYRLIRDWSKSIGEDGPEQRGGGS